VGEVLADQLRRLGGGEQDAVDVEQPGGGDAVARPGQGGELPADLGAVDPGRVAAPDGPDQPGPPGLGLGQGDEAGHLLGQQRGRHGRGHPQPQGDLVPDRVLGPGGGQPGQQGQGDEGDQDGHQGQAEAAAAKPVLGAWSRCALVHGRSNLATVATSGPWWYRTVCLLS
jgi:hypothetical protein